MLVSNLQMSKGAAQKESGTTRASRGKRSGQLNQGVPKSGRLVMFHMICSDILHLTCW